MLCCLNKITFFWREDQKFHNVAIAASVIGAAIWTLTTFNVLSQKEQAEGQLKELQQRIKNTESSTISIQSDIIDYYDKKGLIITVEIKNNGKEKLFFDLQDKPLVIYKVLANESITTAENTYRPVVFTDIKPLSEVKKAKEEKRESAANGYLKGLNVLVNSTKKLNYFVPIDSSGLYYATFTSSPHIGDNKNCSSKRENELESKEEMSCEEPVMWFASKYINVSDSTNKIKNSRKTKATN